MSNQDKAKTAVKKLQGKAKPFPWWKADDVKGQIRLHLSIPSYSSKVSLLMDSSLKVALNTSIHRDKLDITSNFAGGDSLIPRVRDKMAAHFLSSNAEWQLQIDDDIIFPYGLGPNLAQFYSNWMAQDTFKAFMLEGVFPAALSINAIDEILRSGIQDGHKIVGGLYFWRGGQSNFNQSASLIPNQKDGGFSVDFKLTPDNYIKTDKLATGFLLVHREVYEEIAKKFPDEAHDVPVNVLGKPTQAFYTPMITEENEFRSDTGKTEKFRFYRSEDYAFAWRAKQCGYEPILNMNLLLGHQGDHIYSWFDRPMLQKIILDTFDHPMHSIKKMDKEKS